MKIQSTLALVVVAGISLGAGYYIGGNKDALLGTTADIQSVATGTQDTATQVDPDDTIVATVNGDEIRESDILKMYESLPAQYRQVPFAFIKAQLVDQMINMRLVQEAAQTEKYDSQAEFTDRANDVRLQLLQEYYLQKKIDEALTDEALNAEYEKLKAAFEPVEQVHARHILVEKEEDAKKLIEELKAGGDFVELAKEHSTGPSGKDGGDLGFFIKEAMVPEFADAAFAMEVGTYSEEPVKTQFGWHVIKVEGRKPTEISPFEELKDEISDTLTNETVTNLLESLKAAATIEVVEAEVAEPALEADDKAEEKPAEAAPADEKPADEGAETPKTEDKKDG